MSKAVKSVGKVVGKVFKPIAKFLAPSVSMPSGTEQSANLTQTIRSGKEPAHYLYGRTATGGMLAWAQEEAGEQEEGERLDLIYVLAQGEIDGIEEIYVDGEPVATFGDLVQWELHVNRTSPDPYMLAHSPDWRADMIGRGLSYVRVSLRYNPERFASGIPSLLFVVRGNRNIYDPRTGASGYSDNAVLCTLDYVRNHIGVPDDRILWDEWTDAANIADERVTLPGGGTQARYAIGGAIKSDMAWPSAMTQLEECFAGACRRQAGRWGVRVGAYYGPAQRTITPGMIIGPVTGRTEVTRAEAINSVTGTFRSPDQLWEETSYPTVTVEQWVIEDGGENSESADYPLVPNAYQCQRLANIELRSRRAGGMLNLQLNHAGYLLRPGTVVRCDIPQINVIGEFRVINWSQGAKQGCSVVIRQENAEIYDDAVGQPFDPGSFIRLPTGGIGSPTGLRYVVESVGEVVQGVLLWNPVEAALHYNIVIKHDGQAVQSAQVPAGVERCEIGGLVSGSYTAEVRARGRLGQSGPATINITINAPPTPERVIAQRGNREITLIPQIAPGASLNGGHYRYYWTDNPNASQAQSQLLGEGLTFTHTGLAPQHFYYYFVQSVNAYGSSPFLRVAVETTNNYEEEFAQYDERLRRPGGLVDQFENELNAVKETVDDALAEADAALRDAEAALDAVSGIGGDVEQALQRAQDALDRVDLVVLQEQVQRAALSARVSGANASVDVERRVRIAEDQVLAEEIKVLTAELGDATASITQRLTALATLTESLAEQYTELRGEFDDTTAAFEQRISALASQTESIVQTVESLTAQIDDMSAQITETRQSVVLNQLAQATINAAMQARNSLGAATLDVERTVRIDADRALAQLITTLQAEFGDANASYEQRITALVDADRALSDQITTLRSDFNGNAAEVEQRISAISSDQSALASDVSRLRVEVGDEFAEVNRDIAAVYNPRTGAVARAVTTVNVGGRRGMLGIQVDGQLAEIIGVADQFSILNPINNTLVTAFIVADGRVIMPEALINALTITKLRSSNGSLVFQDDRLQAAFIAVEQLRVKWAQIEDVWVTNAQIANAAVDAAKIRDAAVGTLQIGNDAVTVSSSFESAAQWDAEQANWQDAGSFWHDAQGGATALWLTVDAAVASSLPSGAAVTAGFAVRVLLNGVTVRNYGFVRSTRGNGLIELTESWSSVANMPSYSGWREIVVQVQFNGNVVRRVRGCSAVTISRKR